MLEDTGFIKPSNNELRTGTLSAESHVDESDILGVLYNELVKRQDQFIDKECLSIAFELEFKLPVGASEFLEDLDSILQHYGWWNILVEDDGALVSVSLQEKLI